MYDVIVVGARCGGAPTAMLFARRGYRVLLLERRRFPSDTMSTLYIHQPGLAHLAEWGLLDAVAASGCPRLDRVSYRAADVRLDAAAPVLGEIGWGYAPRRYILDQILVDGAVDAGAEFADRCLATDVLWDAGAVTGVRFRGASGAIREERAALVVGADGMNSTIARAVRAPIEREDPLMTCVYYAFWADLPILFQFHERPGGWTAAIPTHDDLVAVAVYLPQHRFATARLDPMRAYLDCVRTTAPALFEQLAGKQPVSPLRGRGDQRNYARLAGGDGWVLVGDSGYHKDTITARGITDALLQAQMLVDAVGDVRDRAGCVRSLQRFGLERDAAFAESYRATIALARLNLGGSRLAILRAVSAAPDLTARYFAVLAGMASMQDLLTGELLDRL